MCIDRDGDSAASTTTAGISGIAGNRAVRTGDKEAGITKIFDAVSVQKNIDAQVQITQTFGQLATKAVADFAQRQADALLVQARNEPDASKRMALLEDAKRWDDGGSYRVAMHAAVGGMGGGVAGAAGAGTVAAAAPMLNNLQNSIVSKLTEAGVNPVIANSAAQALTLTAATAVGTVAGGGSAQGAAAGFNVDANNRQLHPDEKARIKQLAANDPTKEARLTAAACAMAKCYAEYPVNSASYQQLKQLADIGASDALAGERQVLAQQSGMFGYGTNGVFSDANIDAAKQFNNTYQVGTRTIGAVQTVAGGLGVAGSVATAPVSCATGVGCIANAAVATVSADTMYAGAKQVVSGNPESTFLNQGLQGLGMSPQAAGLVEAALGVGSAVTAGAVANKAIDQSIALSKLSTASYQSFTTNGLKATDEVMQTSQAKALIKEIQIGNPTLPQSAVERFAKEYIESGSNLPQIATASQGEILIKVVPSGGSVSKYSGYWMSTQQAQSIYAMTPDQAGKALGLPATQAANILKNGIDCYAISPKIGTTPNVFVSNIASTEQGTLTMPGGAQQILVPNRTQWTTPIQINVISLRLGEIK